MTVHLLLTAAVTPDPAFLDKASRYSMAVADPSVRAQQYRDSLALWARVATDAGARVAVVETSGTPASVLSLPPGTSFVAFAPPPGLVRNGKGAIEAAAVDHALEALALAEDDTFYKITGRLRVANAAKVVGAISPSIVRARRSLDRRFVDTRFLGLTAGAWRTTLSAMASLIHDENGRMLELVVADRLIEAESSGLVRVERFPRVPRILGVSGTTGSVYHTRIPEPLQRKTEGLFAKLRNVRV